MPHFPKPFWKSSRNTWYVEIDGKQHNLGPDREQAFRAYQEVIGAAGKVPQGGNPSLEELVARFLGWVRQERAEKTASWYARYLDSFVRSVPVGMLARDVTISSVDSWVGRKQNWGQGSFHVARRIVKTLFRWAFERRALLDNPLACMKVGCCGIRERLVTPREFGFLIEMARSVHTRDVLLFAWHTGCRPQELRTIEARHLDEAARTLTFDRKNSKGKKHRRVIYLDRVALGVVLRRVKAQGEGYVFRTGKGKKWSAATLMSAFSYLRKSLAEREVLETGWQPDEKELTDLAQQIKVQTGSRKYKAIARKRLLREEAQKYLQPLNAYALRHTFGYRLLVAGVDSLLVARLMGHKDTLMLARVYGHIDQAGGRLLAELDRVTSIGAGE